MIYVGIDNGISGSIGVVGEGLVPIYLPTPTKVEQNYTKQKDNLTRIDYGLLKDTLWEICLHCAGGESSRVSVVMERPLVNPRMFKATGRALRALEATLIALEELGLPHQYLDSKRWQRELLPEGLKGSAEHKRASLDIGIRLFPALEKAIRKQKDADGLLIAEYARRNKL